jgi:hypothetical protein
MHHHTKSDRPPVGDAVVPVEEGLRETKLALDLDPLSVETLGLAAQNEYFAHRYDLAIADLRKALRSRSIAAWR